jgi:hypothetical protein
VGTPMFGAIGNRRLQLTVGDDVQAAVRSILLALDPP